MAIQGRDRSTVMDDAGLESPFAQLEPEAYVGGGHPHAHDQQLAWLELEGAADADPFEPEGPAEWQESRWAGHSDEQESFDPGCGRGFEAEDDAPAFECEHGCPHGECEGPHAYSPGHDADQALDLAPFHDEAWGGSDQASDRQVLESLLESEAGAGSSLAERIKGVAGFVMGPTLRRGSRGAGVATLQRALAALGHDVTADGDFGPGTERAVQAFQRQAGLGADGIVGPSTKAAIASMLGGNAPRSSPGPAPHPSPAPTPTPAPADADVEAFATRLGAEWSRRESGKRSAEAMRDWLLADYRDTLQGCRQRYGSKYGEDVLRRAWMTSREEQMRFQTEAQPGVQALGPLAPPTARPALVSHPSIGGSDVAPVAPVMVRFVAELRRRYPGATAANYRGHGGGSFNNRGHSLDLYIPGRDARGFYPHAEAVKLLRAVDGAAKALQCRWRVIYNDFAVAATVNRETGRRNVIFVGSVRRDKAKRVAGLNWHGPHPLILHFHLDLAPGPSSPQGEHEWADGAGAEWLNESEWLREDEGPPPTLYGPTLRAGDRGEAVQALQQALSRLGDKLTVDGHFGADTMRAVCAFQARSGLVVDGIVGPASKAALAAALGGTPATPASPPQAPAPPVAGRKLSPAQLVAAYGPYARAEQATHGVPALVTLGQLAIESGWGEKAPRNNPFGIKAHPGDPTRQLLRTREVYPTADHRPKSVHPTTHSVTQRADGNWVHVVDAWFRTYPSMQAAFDSHGNVLRHPRYAKAFAVAADPYAFGREIARAGYSTDRLKYERLLMEVMRMIQDAGGP